MFYVEETHTKCYNTEQVALDIHSYAGSDLPFSCLFVLLVHVSINRSASFSMCQCLPVNGLLTGRLYHRYLLIIGLFRNGGGVIGSFLQL